MTELRRGIPTVFDGIEYRSMLEARWAAFMWHIGWDITYEPFEGDGYIPDFLVHAPSDLPWGERGRPFFVEVKPAVTMDQYQEPEAKVEHGLIDHGLDVLIVGAHPLRAPSSEGWDMPCAGRFGEFLPASQDILSGDPQPASIYFSDGNWFECRKCHRIGIFHPIMSFQGRPCGHWDGDGYLGHPPVDVMEAAWKAATNATKWAKVRKR